MAKEKISINLPPHLADVQEKVTEELAVKQAKATEELAVKQAVRDMLMSMASGQNLKNIIDAATGAEKSTRSRYPTIGGPRTHPRDYIVTPTTGSIAKGLKGSPGRYASSEPSLLADWDIIEEAQKKPELPKITYDEEGNAFYLPGAAPPKGRTEYHDDPDKEWFTLRQGAPAEEELPSAPPKSKSKKAGPGDAIEAELLGEEGDPLGLKGVEVKDQGGWSYEFLDDGSIKILTVPKGSKAKGVVLTKGKAYNEIKEKFKSEWLEAQGYPMSDDKEKSVADLVNDWEPETEEGMRYKQELFDVVRKA